jgi:hypothetical protein
MFLTDDRVTTPTAPTTLKLATSKPSGLPMYIYYVIAGVGGAVLLLVVVMGTMFCVCCCHRRWRQKHQGTWTSEYSQRNRSNQNGHSYHNGVVGDMMTSPVKEKEGGFDDPLELTGTPSSPLSGHSDVILHALNHAHDDEQDRYDTPKTKVKAQKGKTNGYHVHTISNGLVLNGRVPNGIGMGDQNSASLSPMSPDSVCPPPDYNELFHPESATPIPVLQANGYHSSDGHMSGCHGNKRDLCEGSDEEDTEKVGVRV